MKDYKKTFLLPTATIRDALKKIDDGLIKIGIVVDTSEKLLGTLTDGDIRRGLLLGKGLEDSIESLFQHSPKICNINDSKAKILQIALEFKLHQIPIVDLDGIVQGVVKVDELAHTTPRSNKVVIMAGGLGTRLQPLTDDTPKPMLHVGNKPILETIIENFAKYGYLNIVLSLSYKADVIEDYFGDGSKFGVHIEYVHETKRLGTAGALHLLEETLSEPFFVMNGDVLTNVNFDHMHSFHLAQKSVATMAVRKYEHQVPYGVVNIVDGIITSIVEKPTHEHYVSAGIYLLDPQVLSEVPKDEFFDMPTLFTRLIQKGESSVSFPIREYWLDVGRIQDYEKANDEYVGIFG